MKVAILKERMMRRSIEIEKKVQPNEEKNKKAETCRKKTVYRSEDPPNMMCRTLLISLRSKITTAADPTEYPVRRS